MEVNEIKNKVSRFKSIEKRLSNKGEHETWTMTRGPGEGDLMYDFIVEMENGDKGVSSAKKTEFRFRAGDNVVYTLEIREGKPDRIKSVSSADRPRQQTSASPGTPQQGATRDDKYKEDPDKAARIVAQSSISSAIEWIKLQPEVKHTSKYLFQVATSMEKWVHGSIERTKKT